MFCKNCGMNVENNSFCTNCGQSVVTKETANKIKSIKKSKSFILSWIFAGLSVLLAASLVLVPALPVSIASSANTDSIGFDTPEEAIEYYIECINNGDYEGALKASYAKQAAQNYDFETFIGEFQKIQVNLPMPSEYELYRVLNEKGFEGQILVQIRGMVLSLTQPEYAKVYTEFEIYETNGDDVDFEGTDPTLIDSIKVIKIEITKIDKNIKKPYRETMEKIIKEYGADSIESRVVLYEYDGDYYVGGFRVIEYDGKYYISAASESQIDQWVSGALIPLDNQSDFEDFIE